MITRDCFAGLCTNRWFHVIVAVPSASRRYPNVLNSVESLKHKDLHISTQSTSETSSTHVVQTPQFSGAGRLLFPTGTHIWRSWDYANTGVVRSWICPDKNISAFLPLPRGQDWRHLLVETRVPCVKQQSRAQLFWVTSSHYQTKKATEDIRPLQTGCYKI